LKLNKKPVVTVFRSHLPLQTIFVR